MDFDDGAATVRVLRLLTEPSRSPGYRVLGHVAIAHEHVARGQLSAARVELAQADSLDFGPSLVSKAYLWLGPSLPLSREELEGLGEQVATWIPESIWYSLWRLYLLGALHERLDDPGGAEGFAAELETSAAALAPQDDSLRERALARDLALSLRARLAAGAERFEEALGFLEATDPEGWWPTAMSTRAYMWQLHERWLTAEVLVSLGRLEEALNWLAPIGGLDGERSYIGVKHLRMAEIYEQLGDREKAVHHYGRFITFWKDADPELQSRVDAARRAIEALSPDT
jgi:tetratricopeptide (TPR) repeat protein